VGFGDYFVDSYRTMPSLSEALLDYCCRSCLDKQWASKVSKVLDGHMGKTVKARHCRILGRSSRGEFERHGYGIGIRSGCMTALSKSLLCLIRSNVSRE
jgi:hypothetical protein